MKIYDVIILGAGASSLMCASNLDRTLDVAVLDINEKMAKKLKISGGGKCNITNVYVESENFLTDDKRFLDAVLKRFSRDDLLEFLALHNIELEVRKNRYYFCKNSSEDVINLFKKLTKRCRFYFSKEVLGVKKTKSCFVINTKGGDFFAKKVVVATGGVSFKTLGATDIGLKIAKSFGMEVREFYPALVGFTVQKEQFWMKKLSGLSCYVHLKVEEKLIKEEMLFAHKGVSGPAILSASLFWQKGKIGIDFLPDKNVLEVVKGSKKLLSSQIPLPKRLCVELLDALGIKDKECMKLDTQEKEKLLNIHDYRFAPAGNFGFSKAEVSRGGVKTDELDGFMQSKKQKGLYFIGEVVDVTGELGGYNFQWAFSSGVVCANGICKNADLRG